MASVQLTVSPVLAGDTAVDGTQVVFTPAAAPEANTRYRFSFAEATAASGGAIAGPLEITLQSTGPLGVASTQPSDGAEDVDPNNPITVIFNRPVVPLTGVDEQASLPQPLDFDPFFEGQGQWISTSVYQFVPARAAGGGNHLQRDGGADDGNRRQRHERAVHLQLHDLGADRAGRNAVRHPGAAGRAGRRDLQPAHGSRQHAGCVQPVE